MCDLKTAENHCKISQAQLFLACFLAPSLEGYPCFCLVISLTIDLAINRKVSIEVKVTDGLSR